MAETNDRFLNQLKASKLSPFTAKSLDILQVNVGKRCNLSCRHCHIDGGPHRTETMSRDVLEQCLAIAQNPAISVVDITGGAPEMNPGLPRFIAELAKLDKRLIVRTNLVILLEDEYESFIDVYSDNNVEIVASLPDFRAAKTDKQRGAGVYNKEIEVLKLLNERGYGHSGSKRILDLVHNPVGAFLPGPQKALEAEFKKSLFSEHGILFNRLFCITNNPSGRYLQYLLQTDNYEEYMQSLISAFNPSAAGNVMCRSTISIGWDGTLFDCDFNQALGLKVNHGAPQHIDNFDINALMHREIVVANHCYACTAGFGSSCQGEVG